MIHILIVIRDRFLPMKMGDLLSFISDDILIIGIRDSSIGRELFGDIDSGLYIGDGIGISDDIYQESESEDLIVEI